MGKNYIKEFMRDNNLELGALFVAINAVGIKSKVKIAGNFRIVSENGDRVVEDFKYYILTGEAKIEKIKPKTLTEQLKEQGYGYVINSCGVIDCIPTKSLRIDRVELGSVKLTESEAEREVHFRKLKHDIQEFARERDCIGEKHIYAITYNLADDEVVKSTNKGNGGQCILPKLFEASFDTEEKALECIMNFSERIRKYYNWNENS